MCPEAVEVLVQRLVVLLQLLLVWERRPRALLGWQGLALPWAWKQQGLQQRRVAAFVENRVLARQGLPPRRVAKQVW